MFAFIRESENSSYFLVCSNKKSFS